MATGKQKNVSNLDAFGSEVGVDLYQTKTFVIVDVFLENQKKEDVTVELSNKSCRVQAKLYSGTYYVKEVHLAGKINPDRSVWTVQSTKVQVKLRKQQVGKWPVLEAVEELEEFRQTYPTINKVDWDMLKN